MQIYRLCCARFVAQTYARLLCGAAILAILFVPTATAQTWDGGGAPGGNLDWITGTNWVGDIAPVNNGTANVVFAGTIDNNPGPNLNQNWNVNSLVFNAAGAFALGSTGSFTLTVQGGGITNSGVNTQMINHALALGAAQSWNASPGGLIFSGAVNNGGNLLTLTGGGMNISNVLSGAGGLTVNSSSSVLSGAAANTYSGTTTVNNGTLTLGKTAGVNAVAGALVIGDGVGIDTVNLQLSNQIADTQSVTINSTDINNRGLLDLNGNSETIAGLIMTGGVGTFGFGTLTIGSLTTNAASSSAIISTGTLSLGGGDRVFTIADGTATYDLDISAVISNANSLATAGAGTLRLSGTNTYGGFTFLQGGTVAIANDAAFGTSTVFFAGTVQADGTDRAIGNQFWFGNGSATFSGTNNLTFSGNVVLQFLDTTAAFSNTGGSNTFFTGVVSGGAGTFGLTKNGAGGLVLAGSLSNTYGGQTVINEGTLFLNKNSGAQAIVGSSITIGDGTGSDLLSLQQSNQIADGVPVTINSSGTLDLQANSEAIGSLTMTGGTVNGTGTLTLLGSLTTNASGVSPAINPNLDLGGGTRTFSIADGIADTDLDLQVAVSNGGITKTGAGLLRFGGATANTFTGTTTVDNGTLVLAKTVANGAVGGPLVIGDSAGTDIVRLDADNQIADNAVVTVNSAGQFNLNGFNETIAGLTMTGGSITTGAGELTLGGNVTTNASSAAAVLSGNLDLGGATRIFNVANGSAATDLDVTATVTNGGVIKEGAGTLSLSGTFLGGVTLNAGTLAGGITIPSIATYTQNGGDFAGTLTNQGTFTFNSGTFAGQLINEGTTTIGANFTAGSGISNFGTLTVGAVQAVTANGSGLDNQGTLTLSSGTLAGSGPLVNNAALSGRGTIAGAAGFANNGIVTIAGGNLSLTNSGANANAGTISVPFGLQLRLLGGNLSNTGLIDLDGGSISGTGTLVNQAGGTVQGGSSIQSPVTNDGGLIHANAGTTLLITNLAGGNINGGELRIDNGSGINVTTPFASSGTIVLLGANAQMIGGAITSSGTIRGSGRVTNSVLSSGSIIAEGGRLTLSGAAPTNAAGGVIQVGPGSEVFYSQGLGVNAGQIALLAGTFDNNNRPLANTGTIAGAGSFRTGGLANSGTIGVGGGDLDVIGAVVNSGSVGTQSGSTVRFFGPVSGAGSYPGTGTVMFLSTFSPGASPARVDFGGDLVLGGVASLTMELAGTTPGTEYDQIDVSGNLALGGVLNVSLLGGFMPLAGQPFDILDWGSLSGTFDAINLPTLSGGLNWNTSQLYTTGTLLVAQPGDFDFDDDVDGRDFLLWQRGGSPNPFSAGDLADWQTQYGTVPLAAVSTAVPEPSTLVLLMGGLVVAGRRRVCTDR